MKPICLWLLYLLPTSVFAQFVMPSFVGGVPGDMHMAALAQQRHQARTLLYLEAIAELKQNPAAADVPDCAQDSPRPQSALCLQQPSPAASSTAPGRRLALLIGNNRYLAPIPELETPIPDVDSLAQVLRDKFGFDTQVIHDVSKASTIGALNQLARKSQTQDTVLIFYAGHGYELDATRMGYWIPVDGSHRSAAGWISNRDISKLLAAIPARQVLLISDSCFSGTLTKEHKVEQFGIEHVPKILGRRSVLAFSSGDEEPVSDEGKDGHSIFAWTLLHTLNDIKHTTPGYHIYQQVRTGVSADAAQTPQYGAVLSAGHSAGGEYLFNPVQ